MSSDDVRLPPDDPAYSYLAKGKQKASDQDLMADRDLAHLSRDLEHVRLTRPSRHRRKRSQSADLTSAASSDSILRDSTRKGAKPIDFPIAATLDKSAHHLTSRQDRRTKHSQNAPSYMRTALPSSPTTGSAEQYISLLGQPAAVSASLSSPGKSSASAATAVLPSLYKAGRGRSINRSPSRRWDRRGASASASVLSGASASESGEEGISTGQPGASHRSTIAPLKDVRFQHNAARRSSLLSNAESLFSSDEEDSALLSSGDEASKASRNKIRSRRWSSVERDRRRGLRVLLYERNVGAGLELSPAVSRSDALLEDKTLRRLSMESDLSLGEPGEASEAEASSPSSSSSSCDLHGQVAMGETAAIPIKNHARRPSRQPVEAASSHEPAPSSSTEASLLGRSIATSTPSTSLLHHSPPGFIELKSIVAIPVSTEADPLLGLLTPSIEELIQIDQVEYFPEEAIASQKSIPHTKTKTSPKSKTSWVIGDFESEPESEDEDATPAQRTAAPLAPSPPTPSASSYQARLASLQSQLRIWSRGEEAPAARTRQISAGSDESDELRDKDSTSLLSASWRNLARLPNLILLPGLAARQAKENLASSKSAAHQHGAAENAAGKEQDFANIFRRAAAPQSPLDKDSVEARRAVAQKTGLPLSPSPGSSPSASHMGSRRSSNDSLNSTNTAQLQTGSQAPRKGRGVATPLEADRDPSAYVSGLGQPIDPDTELSSVVHLQTFRSRSRSRPAAHTIDESNAQHHRFGSDVHPARHPRLSLPKTAKSDSVQVPKSEDVQATPPKSTTSPLQIAIPLKSEAVDARISKGLFQDGPTPLDTASAPTSPTYRRGESGSSSGDEGRTMPPTPQPSPKMEDAEGFRVVRRRNRQRLSGPRSYRPKVEAPVPNGFSAFALDETDDKNGSDSDEELSPRSRGRRGRARRGRDPSPPSGSRQCAVGLFGGGISSGASPSTMSSRPRGGSRRETSQPSGMRSVRSSPDLTYAAAAAAVAQAAADFEGQQAADKTGEQGTDVSPPRGLRGRRGAVKVVASSVGQWPLATQPLLLPGIAEGLRRGPSYPPRADQMLDDTPAAAELEASPATASASPASAKVASHARAAHTVRSRSSASPSSGGGFGSPPLHTLRFRLLSNSSHLLMLSLELDMIKKQKISAPLKPRWGKHRANDFNPLPSVLTPTSSSSAGVKEHDTPTPARSASPASPIAIPSRWETNTRDPGSKLRFSWSPDA